LITEDPESKESEIYFTEILKTLMSILCSANLYMSMYVFLDTSRNVVGIEGGGGWQQIWAQARHRSFGSGGL